MSQNQYQQNLNDDSDNQAPLQISTKPQKNPSNKSHPHKTKQITKTRTKKPQKSHPKLAQMKKKLRAQLKQQFQQQKMLQQLKKIPLRLEERENKVVRIADTVRETRKLGSIGVELVHKSRRMVRKPDQEYRLRLDLGNPKRGSFQDIRCLKRSKKN